MIETEPVLRSERLPDHVRKDVRHRRTNANVRGDRPAVQHRDAATFRATIAQRTCTRHHLSHARPPQPRNPPHPLRHVTRRNAAGAERDRRHDGPQDTRRRWPADAGAESRRSVETRAIAPTTRDARPTEREAVGPFTEDDHPRAPPRSRRRRQRRSANDHDGAQLQRAGSACPRADAGAHPVQRHQPQDRTAGRSPDAPAPRRTPPA